MASKFKFSYSSFPFHNKDQLCEFESIGHASAEVLRKDDFVRTAYYPVFLGSNNFPPPSPEQQVAAFSHLDQYLLVLPTISVEPFIQDTSYGRPQAGDCIIHMNSSLCAASMTGRTKDNSFAKLLIAGTILHEIAHTYGFNTRPNTPGYSPQELSIVGHQQRIRVGSPDIVVGEAGYVVEHRVFGGILHAVIPEHSQGFQTILGVHLERDGVFYDISVQVANSWIRDFFLQETKSLWDMVACQSVSTLEAGHKRCKCMDLSLSTHFLATQDVPKPPATPPKWRRVGRGLDRRPNAES